MLRYYLAAFALKCFSMNRVTKRLYRWLGNRLGGKKRSRGISRGYVERAEENLRHIESHRAIADGMSVLELGTGWVNWEALYTRSFYEVDGWLTDVWDNRQFDGFMGHAAALKAALGVEIERDPAQLERASALLDKVLKAGDFDEVDSILGFRYSIDSEGSLAVVPDASVDLVFSSDVMEHVPARAVPVLVEDLYRILRPGGYVAQRIAEGDHLCNYSPTANKKNYLRYSERVWKLFLDNDVQHINLLQHSDFVDAFKAGGFEIVAEEVVSSVDTSMLKIHKRFAGYSSVDLDANVTRLLVRKPL